MIQTQLCARNPWRGFWLSLCVWGLCLPTLSRAGAAQPWWENYPLISQTDDLALCQRMNADVGFVLGQTDPGFGIYGQRLYEQPAVIDAFHKAGLKTVSYYEGFGTSTNFIVELKARGALDYTPVGAWHWNWEQYLGGPIRWVGPQNYFDCEDFAGIYTRKHPRYGGPAMTYPDGTIATGWIDNETTNPFKSRVIDAAACKNILGQPEPEVDVIEKVNQIDPKTHKPKGPINGLVYGFDQDRNIKGYSGHLNFQKDAACPYWADLQYSSVLMGADHGLDGMWVDNFGPWDSLGHPALSKAFGDWSVARFRDYLGGHFSPQTLKQMGADPLQTFDVRAYLRERCKAWGGVDTDLNSNVWYDPRFGDDPIWRSFLIFKRQTITQALTDYYAATKSAARRGGKPAFFVMGNDTPLFSLGCPRDNVDMVSAEMTASWHMGTSARGVMLPPLGRFAPLYKISIEHAKSRFMTVWMYLVYGYEKHQGKPGIANVLQYEMLASHALPMIHPEMTKAMGTAESNASFFKFVKEVRPTFGQRVPVQDIGVYYSSSSLLSFLAPAGFQDINRQPHSQGFYGWCTALGELHYQYRTLPEWRLTPEALFKLRVLVIPNADVFVPADAAKVLEPWVRAGGLLIVTGNSGYRLGEADNLDVNPRGLSLAGLTGVSAMDVAPDRRMRQIGVGKVLYLRDNIGMDYFNAISARFDMLPKFAAAMNEVLAGQGPLILTPGVRVPGTVGLTMYEDAAAHRLFIDANNLNINLANDQVTPTPRFTFEVKLPDYLRKFSLSGIRARVLSPGGPVKVKVCRVGQGRAAIALDPVQYYGSVVLEPAQPLWAMK